MCPFRRVGSSPTWARNESLQRASFFLTKVACRVWVLIQMRTILMHLPFHHDLTHHLARRRAITFHGIFEPELLENILSMGHHMLVPEGTMLMDVGQTMDDPLLLEGAIKILRLDQTATRSSVFLGIWRQLRVVDGNRMGNAKSSIRAVTERDTSLVMVPVQLGQEWMKSTHLVVVCA